MNCKIRLSHHLRGFSLVEVLVSTVIFALGASASLTVLFNSINATSDSIEVEETVALGIEAIEHQRASLLPTASTETIGDYTRTTTVAGCSFVGTTLTCNDPCDAAATVCRVVVSVTDNLTNETRTITTMKLAEEL